MLGILTYSQTQSNLSSWSILSFVFENFDYAVNRESSTIYGAQDSFDCNAVCSVIHSYTLFASNFLVTLFCFTFCFVGSHLCECSSYTRQISKRVDGCSVAIACLNVLHWARAVRLRNFARLSSSPSRSLSLLFARFPRFRSNVCMVKWDRIRLSILSRCIEMFVSLLLNNVFSHSR